MPASEDKSDDGPLSTPDFGDAIDSVTFGQILEMDEDENDRDFSQSIVFGFFEQAEETFEQMDEAFPLSPFTPGVSSVADRNSFSGGLEKDLEKLSSLGHFLKGSSATLGLVKVRDSCEKIQRYGKKENEDGTPETDEKLCLERIEKTLKDLKTEYEDAEKLLKKFFGTEEEEEED
ncbi:hpt domain-containing protein [Colletotrichum lupini]|uniref:Hpt domain-containing protein n=1 Tax=Colletotrichum lupini TaxID=145971 RepID=A0A9Q8W902_9PEZI|nr:hpt domain-containing protein [Colletotrichum lupini]UQC74481.1 hpt domain-containing protein [Colletotrichum lupini]